MGLNTKSSRCILKHDKGIDYYVIANLEEVQCEMIKLLSIIDRVCQENNIKYWLDGGTLLGALRHNGFIPWDDDIDISILKSDYLKLISALEKFCDNSSEYYLLYSHDNINEHVCNFFCSTKNLYGRSKGAFNTIPIKLDIRPVNVIKNTSSDILLNAELRGIANAFIYGASRINYTELSQEYRHLSKKDFFDFYNFHYGLEEVSDSSVLSFPYYEFASEGTLSCSIISSFVRHRFNGIDTYIPAGYDSYLKMLYGDYMKLPDMKHRAPAQFEYISLNHTLGKQPYSAQGANISSFGKLKNFIQIYGYGKFLMIAKERVGLAFNKIL